MVSVAVAPQAVTVPTGGSTQFAATVANAPDTRVQWEVNGVPGGASATGTINSDGLYVAPNSVPATTVEVTAVLQADISRYGLASVTVVTPVSVSPRQTALTTSQSVQFQATGPSADTAGVTWSASDGAITTDGLYVPSRAGIFTITATSRTDSGATANATVYVTDYTGQSSWRNDSGLTGQNRQELALSPATLGAGNFGKVSSCAVDGQVHAQPLYAVAVNDGSSTRNVIYVATEHDSVYAFDADAIPCQQIWRRRFFDDATGISAVPGDEIPGNDRSAEVGIAGTPVIDRTSGTLYVVARTRQSGPTEPTYKQHLHALDILTGDEKLGGPVLIAATVPCGPLILSGSVCGDGNDGSNHILFDPLIQGQRGALLLVDGKLYITFGGHGAASRDHGWLLVYDAATLARVGAFNSTPNAVHGGFTQSGAGVSADASGNVFVAAGHGTFDAALSAPFRTNFGQTLLKFQTGLTIADTFTPSNQSALTTGLVDFGSTGVLIVPDQTGVTDPPLALTGATNGTLYLVNRDVLGGYAQSGSDSVALNLGRGIYGTPGYWQNTVYVAAAGDVLKAYPLAGGTLLVAPSSQSSSIIGGFGASPVVSSNGESEGVVWVVDTSGADSNTPAILRAFDATDLGVELYNSASKSEDAAGAAARLAVPTVANGRVYVGTQNEVTVYGLTP